MTEQTQQNADDAASAMPQFYKKPVVLRSEEHNKVGVRTPAGFDFTREATAIPLGIGEFMPGIRHYPIVFSDTDTPTPLAVLGIKQGRNLFLEDDGSWRVECYVPAYARRYPFILTETPDRSARLLTVDVASDRFTASADGDQETVRLFDDTGGPTADAHAAMAFCQAFHDDHQRTAAFVDALKEARLLSPNRAEMTFPDSSRYTLDGFLVVDEVAFRALPASTLEDWHKRGWLTLIGLHLASRQNWQALLDLNAIRTNAHKVAA